MVGEEDRIAMINDKGNSITYGQINEFSERFGKIVEKRAVTIILASNTIESILVYISCIRNRVIPLLLRKDITKEVLSDYIERYHVKYICMYNENSEKYADVVNGESLMHRFCEYSIYRLKGDIVNVHKELALLLTTSGSTGTLKSVRISYKNLLSNTINIVKYLKINRNEIGITSLPMNYTYGLSVINTYLYMRATLLVTDLVSYGSNFWDFFKEYGATSFAGVPYTYEMLQKMGFAKMSIPSLKTMTVAGGKLKESQEKYLMDYALNNGKELIIMYGQTEATARISYKPFNVKDKNGSVGIAIPNGKMWLEDNFGNVIDIAYVSGEIVYSGNNVAMGYAENDKCLLKGYEWKNVLHTGDIGYMDNDQYFYVTGRKDRMVKISGVRIALDEVEELLEKKFECYKFKCEIEKCVGEYLFKRIRIKLVSKYANQNKHNGITGKDIIEYISNRSKRLISGWIPYHSNICHNS